MINLSAPFSYEAIPLIKAIENHPSIHFEWGEWQEVKRDFKENKVDGILCPPLEVLEFPGSFVIPGVGIASCGKIPSPFLCSSYSIDSLRKIVVSSKFDYWKKWLEIIFKIMTKSPIDVFSYDKYPYEDDVGYLLDVLEFNNENVRFQNRYNLGSLWKKITSYPFVCWVWLCHGNSNYKQIRSVLGYIWDVAKENLKSYQRGNMIESELLDSQRNTFSDLEDVYYSLASLEFEGMHWFIEEGKRVKVVPEESEFHLC
ncbi:MAG TPA: hypothetical protein PLT82_01635 [Candidatus Hydrogenedens sp.]|nr:hypothetical protein [Candidatus Hydrogenedens sp.]HOK08519.1 hypothetical protein [Candidatus Hydrogenedens sp.]HOL19007.1 hypothetical protein [Candidatus Hydrogenedens sp.]HPP57811.1 hypothetical protein [Candidatus Hydrogenedens sp.]